MSEEELKINFRYLTGNIACMSVDSVEGKPVHNDINNEESIIIFNSLVGEKENCKTVKTLLEENEQLKNNWNELKKWLESKNNITLTQHKTIEPVIKVQEVIDKIKEVM